MHTKYVPGSVLRTGDAEVNTAIKVPWQHPGADIWVCVCVGGEGGAGEGGNKQMHS